MNSTYFWRPIETAPKDGTRILVFGGRVTRVETAYILSDGIITCEVDEDRRIPSDPPCGATIWMPLPDPPMDEVK